MGRAGRCPRLLRDANPDAGGAGGVELRGDGGAEGLWGELRADADGVAAGGGGGEVVECGGVGRAGVGRGAVVREGGGEAGEEGGW